jgi:HSP20 family protein
MSIIRYQPPQTLAFSGFDRLSNLRDELDTLFEMPFWSNFGRQSQLFSGWSPALDLYQSNDNVIARVELPGMRKEDIEISLHDGMLTINGERQGETSEGDKAERTERYVGKFRRSISLPTQVDANKVTANYRDGILTVTLPKAEEAKPKQIKVDVA